MYIFSCRLVRTAVSDREEEVVPVMEDKSNEGGTRMIPIEQLAGSGLESAGPPVTSTTLTRLVEFADSPTVIIKMDIEGYECKALVPFLSSQQTTFVPYIFMEWWHVQRNTNCNCPDLVGLVDLLYSTGYTAVNPNTWVRTEREELVGGGLIDIVWIHKSVAV